MLATESHIALLFTAIKELEPLERNYAGIYRKTCPL